MLKKLKTENKILTIIFKVLLSQHRHKEDFITTELLLLFEILASCIHKVSKDVNVCHRSG